MISVCILLMDYSEGFVGRREDFFSFLTHGLVWPSWSVVTSRCGCVTAPDAGLLGAAQRAPIRSCGRLKPCEPSRNCKVCHGACGGVTRRSAKTKREVLGRAARRGL